VHVSPAARKRVLRVITSIMASCLTAIPPKPKNATTQIKLLVVLANSGLEGWHDPALDVFAPLGGFNDAGFAKNANMFRGIILRDLQAFGQLAHRERGRQQFPHDAPPRFVHQRFQKRSAIVRMGCGHAR
jgi:hypothetical protein